MSLITEPASYRGVVVEHAVSMTKEKGLPQFVAKFRALEKYDSEEKVWIDWSSQEDSEITAYLVLFSSTGDPIFHAKDVQKVFEWDGASLMALNLLELEGAEVQFEVVEHTYKEKTSLQVANIRGYNEEPGGSVKKLDDDELVKLNANFSNALKKLSGGPKVAKADKTTTAKDKNNPPALTATAEKDESTATKVAAKRGRPKKTTTAPPPPAAPTEVEATTEAAKEVPDVPVEEAIEEFNKKDKAGPASPPAAPKALPSPPSATKTTAPVNTMTYEEAWTKCYGQKAKTVDDKTIAAAFTAAMHRQAPGVSEAEISGEDWALIAEAVIGECG